MKFLEDNTSLQCQPCCKFSCLYCTFIYFCISRFYSRLSNKWVGVGKAREAVDTQRNTFRAAVVKPVGKRHTALRVINISERNKIGMPGVELFDSGQGQMAGCCVRGNCFTN
jgi:hypothetical protein